MRDPDPADETQTFDRRTTLKATAGLVAGGALFGTAAASGDESADGDDAEGTAYYVRQGDRAFEIDALSGDVPVEELYDYRLPAAGPESDYEGVGATTPDEGPYYGSIGTEELQENATSVMFLYDGPDGLSLVVVHDGIGGSDGGSTTWEVAGVPEDAEWIVKDDYYVDPDTGEPASTNYDRWDTDGTAHTVDWTWADEGTDGGVLAYLGETFAFTVYPAFNDAADLYGEHYSGDVDDWEVLSGDLDDPERHSLDLDAPVTLSTTEAPKDDDERRDENGEDGRKEGDGEESDGSKSDGTDDTRVDDDC